MNKIFQGDCLHMLQQVPDASVDLIITSPPYAMAREGTYGGIPHKDYVRWFAERSPELWRVLKPTGSFVLNIKENVVDGERHPYVLRLMLRLIDDGWRWIDEFCWHKKCCYPGKWPNRLKDGWERLSHFTKKPKGFKFYPDEVRIPAAESTTKRMKYCSERDKARQSSQTGSSFGSNRSQMGGEVRRQRATGSKFGTRDEQIDRSCVRSVRPTSGMDVVPDGVCPGVRSQGENASGMNIVPEDGLDRQPMALPSNVLHLPTECKNRGHSAVFPEALPQFFINLMTQAGDVVLDPFMGSGTVAVVAKRLGRQYIGVELLEENIKLIHERLEQG